MAVSRHPSGACSTLMAALMLCLLSIGTAQAGAVLASLQVLGLGRLRAG